MKSFIENTEEFKDLQKGASEIKDKIKTNVNDKIELMKTKFTEAATQKESEIVAYEALKASISGREGISQTDKDKEVKGLEAKIARVNVEINALKKVVSFLNNPPQITGTIESYFKSAKASLATLKASIDAELAKLENPTT